MRFFRNYILSRQRFLQILIDTALILLSLFLAYSITNQNISALLENQSLFIKLALVVVIIKLSVNGFCGIYRQIWRYLSPSDIINILKAVSLSTIISFALIYFRPPLVANKTLLFLDWIFCITFLSLARIIRSYFTLNPRFFNSKSVDKKRVLLYGAGSGGEIFLKQTKRDHLAKIKIVGFIDDDLTKVGSSISGIKVLGTSKELPRIIDKYKIEMVIITIPIADKKIIERTKEAIRDKQVKIKRMPSLYEILEDKTQAGKIRDINIEDLIRRKTISIDFDYFKKVIEGKKIFLRLFAI